MRSVSTRRRVSSYQVRDELGNLRHHVLTTHRNQDIEVVVAPNRANPVEITKRPDRLTEEQARCLLAILQHGLKLLSPAPVHA
jgi:hypothetical protein